LIEAGRLAEQAGAVEPWSPTRGACRRRWRRARSWSRWSRRPSGLCRWRRRARRRPSRRARPEQTGPQ